MQNVAWPMTMVKKPSGKAELGEGASSSAMPVTMPGNAIGKMTMNEIVSRPKNR